MHVLVCVVKYCSERYFCDYEANVNTCWQCTNALLSVGSRVKFPSLPFISGSYP